MRSSDQAAWNESLDGLLPRAIIAGFVATAAMTAVLLIAYAMSALLAQTGPQASTFQQWLWGLTNNVVSQQVQTTIPIAIFFHLLVGIGWAIVYAVFVAPRLPGPGWARGMLFSLLPWLVSLLIFLPAIGGGLAGLALGAGPLPIIGNLIAHLVYGATLGQLCLSRYSRPLVEWGAPVDPGEMWTLRRAERSMAVGLLGGLLLGTALGWISVGVFGVGTSPWLSAVACAALGGSFGALVGSFFGLSVAR